MRRLGTAALRLAVVAAVLALLGLPSVAGATVSPLPRSDYTIRSVCARAAHKRAGCLALQLVPRTAAARERKHPLGFTRNVPLTAPSPSAGAFGLRPQDLHTAYQLPTSASSAQTVALVDAYNDPNAESDLKAYDEEFSLPACTTGNGCFKQVNQNGEAGNLPFPKTTKELESARKGTRAKREEAEEATGWGLEISLDIEVAHTICQSCDILLVESNSPTYENLEAAEQSAATLGAGEISNSWAGPEEGETPELESTSPFNHPGLVIAAASGDDGYLNWDAENSAEKGHTNFPASSPHVVAVGGTHLSLGTGSAWAGETAWNGYGAGGGGCSVVFTAQPWQQSPSNWSAVGCNTKRAVADVSADADPYTGVAVRDTSPECEYRYEEAKVKHTLYWCTIGGTSLATPLISSTFALAGGSNGVEYPAKTLYENEVKSTGSLHDVITGSNGECTKPFLEGGLSGCTTAEEAKSCASRAICIAGTGYDGPTGVGTPDGIAGFKPPPNQPTAVTGVASGISQTSATLGATVNPNGGEVSKCTFEYGTTEAYETSVPCSSLPGSGESPVAVSASITTLAANTIYHFRIVASNAGGTSYGSDQAFKTLPDPPVVVIGAASLISQTSATLGATVNPNGGEVSECKFEYGTTMSYGSSVPCSPAPGSGSSPVAVSASATSLAANTTYHYRISATNGGGTNYGSDQTFKTLAASSRPTVSSVSPSSGSVNGGTHIRITGTNFVAGASVEVAQGYGAGPTAIQASEVVVVSPTEITATTGGGAKAGTFNLFVIDSGGTSPSNAPADDYAYKYPQPTVSSVSPSSGTVDGGTSITITGTGFVASAKVEIGQGQGAGPTAIQASNVVVVSPTEITATTGGSAKAGTWNLLVIDSGGTSPESTNDKYTYK